MSDPIDHFQISNPASWSSAKSPGTSTTSAELAETLYWLGT